MIEECLLLPCSPPKTSSFSTADTNKSRGGYGVTAEDITYASGEDFDEEEEEEDEEEDEDVDMSYLDLPLSDEDKASSSGESSSPSSTTSSPITQTIKPTYVGASTSKISYILDEDIPISHERSTKDLLAQDSTKNVERMEQLKKRISESIAATRENDILEANVEFVGMRTVGGGPTRPRVTIGSLMNKALDTPRNESEKDRNSGKRSTRKPLPVCDFYIYDDLTLSDCEVEVIPKEKFQAAAKSSSDSRSKQPIVIDDDDEMLSDDDDGMDGCIDMEGDDEQNEEEEEEASSDDEAQSEKDFEMKESGNIPTEHPITHEETISQSEPAPMSPPDVMSSKIPAAPLDPILAPPQFKPNFRSPIEELTHAAVAAMQAPTPPPSATLPPLSKIRDTVIKKTASGASHIHWLGDNTTPTPNASSFQAHYPDLAHIGIGSMEQKKEYFEAREINRARDTRSFSSRITRVQDASPIICPAAFRSTSKSPPPPQPYIVDGMPWVHGSKSGEVPKEALGLFPNVLEPETPKPIVAPPRTDKATIPSPPPTVSSQAKRLLEDAVADGEKVKAFDTKFSNWWPQGEEVDFEIDDDAEVHWDDDIANDEDGEYDEEEDDEEQNKGDEAEEEDMNDANLDNEYDEEYEEECELEEEQQDDDIRTDVSEYDSSSIRNDLANDEPLFFSPQEVLAAVSSITSPNSHFGRTSVSEAGKSDFTKSRGFSISNLVNENTITPPRPQLAATGTFYPTRPLINLPCRVIHQVPGQFCTLNPTVNVSANHTSQAKEKSMADLLNPFSPAAGCKRKHEEISNIAPEEVPEPKYPCATKPSDSDNMDDTDDDLEPQDEDERQKDDGRLTSEASASLTEENQPPKSAPATTANTAVQVSVAETKTVGSGSEVGDEPPKKKVKTGSSAQIAKFAATALAGAIVGGVGMFAALVATAPAP